MDRMPEASKAFTLQIEVSHSYMTGAGNRREQKVKTCKERPKTKANRQNEKCSLHCQCTYTFAILERRHGLSANVPPAFAFVMRCYTFTCRELFCGLYIVSMHFGNHILFFVCHTAI